MSGPVVGLSLKNSAEQTENMGLGILMPLHKKSRTFSLDQCNLSPVCQVVVGIGHVDQTLDEIGALDQAEEHLQTNRQSR